MKEKEHLIDIIEKYALEPYKTALLKEIQPSIRLKTNGRECPETGKTKLGGCPDLPPNISWPKSDIDQQSLTFLGQINLKEVKMLDELDFLSQSGILYFFFNLDSVDDGKVLYVKEETGLERAAPPESFKEQKKSLWQRLLTGKSKKRLLKESQVELSREYDIPSWDSLRMEKIKKENKTPIEPVNAFEEAALEDIYEEAEAKSNHRLTGLYKGIQNEYHEMNFIDTKIKDTQDLTLDQINKALEWKLLFQFDSDANLEANFVDWGRVYFFVLEEDMLRGEFGGGRVYCDFY